MRLAPLPQREPAVSPARANPEYRLSIAQVRNPHQVTRKIGVRRLIKAVRVCMHDADDAQVPVQDSHLSRKRGLKICIEGHMRYAGALSRTSRQGRLDEHLVTDAASHQRPAAFDRRILTLGQRLRNAFRQHQAFDSLI